MSHQALLLKDCSECYQQGCLLYTSLVHTCYYQPGLHVNKKKEVYLWKDDAIATIPDKAGIKPLNLQYSDDDLEIFKRFPVSYTHLDVYKRQILERPQVLERCDNKRARFAIPLLHPCLLYTSLPSVHRRTRYG